MSTTSEDWRVLAACRTEDPALFFPSDEEHHSTNYSQAKQICAACPVRTECLHYACRNSIIHGFWGGLPPKARRPIARQLGYTVEVTA